VKLMMDDSSNTMEEPSKNNVDSDETRDEDSVHNIQEFVYQDDPLAHQHEGDYLESRINSFLWRITSLFPFRRKPRYTPLYGLDNGAVPKPGSAKHRSHWSMCMNCSFFTFAFM
jgi:hypothetical protein